MKRSLQWGRGLSPTETRVVRPSKRRAGSFNGAAGFRPRRPFDIQCGCSGWLRLQWGRGLSPTETCLVPVGKQMLVFASMGPRAFAHGDLPPDTGAPLPPEASMGPRAFAHGDHRSPRHFRRPDPCFNGAAGFRPRRLPGIGCNSRTDGMLQWGRGLSPTETSDFNGRTGAIPKLQWGRGLSPTETSLSDREIRRLAQCFNGAAGFRPRRLVLLA